MILRIQAEDGQDFIISVGEGKGSVSMATSCCNKPNQADLEDFTIEEAEAIIGAISVAIQVAKTERDYSEKTHGN